MDRKMYSQIESQAALPDAPPSYDQTINEHVCPTAPSVSAITNIQQSPISTQPQQEQQQQREPQIVVIQTLQPLGLAPCTLVCPNCHQQLKVKAPDGRSKKFLALAGCVICCLGMCCAGSFVTVG